MRRFKVFDVIIWAVAFGLIASISIVPLLAPFTPNEGIPERQFSSPSTIHWLGTDQFGRDVLSRVLWGGRMSLAGASTSTIIAVILGTLLGAGAAAFGGRTDWVLMRLVDIMLAFPSLLLAMIFASAVGPGLWPVAAGTGVALAPGFSRLVRSSLVARSQAPFVQAAYALGASKTFVIFKHLIPNIAVEVISYGTVLFAWSLLNIAALEFLGLAGPPDQISWGRMLYEGRSYLRIAPWISLAAGSAILVTTLCVLGLGEAVISHRIAR